MSLQFLNVESCEGKQCHGVREASRTVTVQYTNTYCVSCFLQSVGCKKRRVDGSPDGSNLEPLEILWLFFPLLVLNVQQHVVQRLGKRNPRHRLAASLLQSCNLGPDPPRRFILQNVNVAKLLSVLQFFAYCETQFLNLSACFCAMLTTQNVK